MPNCDLYDQTGARKGKLALPEEIFGVEPHTDLMHRALVMQQANRRQALAHTKTRGEISISKRKIYRQKGTGNARHGSKNANTFRGGGVVFGPRSDRNFSKMMPRQQRRLALFSALSTKAAENKILGLTDFTTDTPKTKSASELIQKMQIERGVLFILPEKNENFTLSVRNLPNTKTITANYVNVEDLLKYNNIVIFEKSVAKMQELFQPREIAQTEKTSNPNSQTE